MREKEDGPRLGYPMLCHKAWRALELDDARGLHEALVQGLGIQTSIKHEGNLGGKTLLGQAAGLGSHGCVKILLEHGADPNAGDEFQSASPAHYAAYHGKERCLRELANHGADMDGRGKAGSSPLMIACQQSHEECVKVLISCGADVNMKVRNGDPLIFEALNSGTQEGLSCALLLIEAGARINECGSSGLSALRFVLSPRFPGSASASECVAALLAHGADPDIADDHGTTALHACAIYGLKNIAKMLLKYGANPSIPNRYNKQAYELAWNHGFEELSEELRAVYEQYKLQAIRPEVSRVSMVQRM